MNQHQIERQERREERRIEREERRKERHRRMVKSLVCMVAIGIVCVILRIALIPTIPALIALGAGFAVAIVALILAVIERRNDHYPHGKNWNGRGIGNSALLFGVAVFFFAATITHAIYAIISFAVLYILIHLLVKPKARERQHHGHRKAEKNDGQ